MTLSSLFNADLADPLFRGDPVPGSLGGLAEPPVTAVDLFRFDADVGGLVLQASYDDLASALNVAVAGDTVVVNDPAVGGTARVLLDGVTVAGPAGFVATLTLAAGVHHFQTQGAADFRITGNGENNGIFGAEGNDILKGQGGADFLEGWTGNDRLIGGAGRDILLGMDGADTLLGGGGRDELIGGRGADVLTGGVGADSFVFEAKGGRDRITDFEDDIDTLRLDPALWDNARLTRAQVVAEFGADTEAGLVLTFGPGLVVTVAGMDSASILNDLAFL
ncbi:hypothetical protein RNZ50_00510 [Paracoccaceae bacterium Fryx2]|nr:hypothetical protein [Paracoccaceae bacterium Fryx2]